MRSRLGAGATARGGETALLDAPQTATVQHLAERIEAALLLDGDGLLNQCHRASGLLYRLLTARGCAARVVFGTFEHEWAADPSTKRHRHHWVELDLDGRSYIADATIRQFDPTAPLLRSRSAEVCGPGRLYVPYEEKTAMMAELAAMDADAVRAHYAQRALARESGPLGAAALDELLAAELAGDGE